MTNRAKRDTKRDSPEKQGGDPKNDRNAGGPSQNAPMAPPDAVFGQVVGLMMNTANYRHVFLSDLEWMVLPPIMLSQYRLFRARKRIVGFAAWAFLSEDAEVRIQAPNPRLAPADWKSGERLWLITVLSPYGPAQEIVKELQTTALKGLTFRLHHRSPDGSVTIETFPPLQ